jgi:uncharacterized protein
MKKIQTIFVIGICLIAGILIAGCTQPSSSTAPVTNSGAAVVQPSVVTPITNSAMAVSAETSLAVQPSMANPASVNCGKVSGSTEIKKNADGGEYGMCTFTNGTSCEEWALYRGEGCKTNVTAPVK